MSGRKSMRNSLNEIKENYQPKQNILPKETKFMKHKSNRANIWEFKIRKLFLLRELN
jgi:hypothetical protein